jgi:hypothetical protein
MRLRRRRRRALPHVLKARMNKGPSPVRGLKFCSRSQQNSDFTPFSELGDPVDLFPGQRLLCFARRDQD